MLTGIVSPSNILNNEMPAPQFISTASTIGSSSTTSHTINMPAGALAGDIVRFTFTLSASLTYSFPAGWNGGGTGNVGTSTKTLDGTEGSTVIITTTSAGYINALGVCYRNAYLFTPVASTQSSTSSSTATGLAFANTAITPQMATTYAIVVFNGTPTINSYPFPNHHVQVLKTNTLFEMNLCSSDPFLYENSYTQPNWVLSGNVDWVVTGRLFTSSA